MALVALRQVLNHAAGYGYGVPAFNVNNLVQFHAIMQAAEDTASPVILQASAGARLYAGEPCLRHLVMHGGSCVLQEWLANIRLAMIGAMRQGRAEKPGELDPRAAPKAARQAAQGVCRQCFEALGCAGMAPRIWPVALGAMGKRYA